MVKQFLMLRILCENWNFDKRLQFLLFVPLYMPLGTLELSILTIWLRFGHTNSIRLKPFLTLLIRCTRPRFFLTTGIQELIKSSSILLVSSRTSILLSNLTSHTTALMWRRDLWWRWPILGMRCGAATRRANTNDTNTGLFSANLF